MAGIVDAGGAGSEMATLMSIAATSMSAQLALANLASAGELVVLQ